MRFTFNQLKKYLKTDLSPLEIADKLTMIGLEIEEVKDMRGPLAGFIVAEIAECKRHPDSDHLNLLKVNTGAGIFDVVCGAPNVKVGLRGIFADVGSIMPYNGMKLKKGVIRGADSCGMMCSEMELCLGTDHDGIIELPLELNAEIGGAALNVLEKLYTLDVMMEGNVLPNRPDYLGVMGIARDLAAAGAGEFIAPVTKEIKGEFETPIKVINNITDDVKEFNTRYIKGVKNSVSPKWLAEYLQSVEMKSISSLVDITNYCLHNINRPLHVFDADKIKGDVVIDYAKGGEEFIGLDEVTYTLNEGDIVIKDDSGVISLAGVMGGLATACSMDSTNILLESAYFNPQKNRKTAKQLKIETESKSRFERGIDQMSTTWGLDFATSLVLEIAGGEASKIFATGKTQYKEYEIEFPVKYFKERIGFDIEKAEMISIVQKLGCKVEDKGEELVITPPSYREDLEGKHDITEELVRIYGFEKLPAAEVVPTINPAAVDARIVQLNSLPRMLANRGMTEVYTWSFMSDKKELEVENSIELLNPITSDLNVMRQSIVPNLIDGVKENLAKGISSSSLFEVGPTFNSSKPLGQNTKVAGIRQGLKYVADWASQSNNLFDVYDIKNDVIEVLKIFGVNSVSIKYSTENLPEFLNPYKSANIIFANKVIGYLGEVHPLTLKKFGIKNALPIVFEINLDMLPQSKKKSTAKKKVEISELLNVVRDFAVIIDDSVLAGDILNAVKNSSKEYIKDAIIFDIYKGDKLPVDKKSVAIKIIIGQKEKTLNDEEINKIFKLAIDATVKLGGELRDK